jgi:GTPase-associated protein 1, N-terminal domain type 2/GTPase-associated protein 1, middle domain
MDDNPSGFRCSTATAKLIQHAGRSVMSQELFYTSARAGLKPGTLGFCTVAMTRDMPAAFVGNLESLSGYRHLSSPNDPQQGKNPINFGHWILSSRGRPYHILGRIGPAPADYSGRSNKIAHYVVLDSGELPAGGPAWLLRQPGFMQDSWSGAPHWLDRGREIPNGDRPPAPCEMWKAAAGDAGWAGVLIQSFLEQPDTPVYILSRHGVDLPGLFEEAIALLPAQKRWEIAFSTYFNGLPIAGLRCHWRGVYSGTQQADEIGSRALVIDLTRAPKAIPANRYVDAARAGALVGGIPAKVTVAKQPALVVHQPAATENSSARGFQIEDLAPPEPKENRKPQELQLPSNTQPWSVSARLAINETEQNARLSRKARFPWGAMIFIFLLILLVMAVGIFLVYRNMLGPLQPGIHNGPNQSNSSGHAQNGVPPLPAASEPNGNSPSPSGLNTLPTSPPLNGQAPTADHQVQAGNNNAANGMTHSSQAINNFNLNNYTGTTIFEAVQAEDKPIFTLSGPASGLSLTNTDQSDDSFLAAIKGVEAVRVKFPGANVPIVVETDVGQSGGDWFVPNDGELKLNIVSKGGAGELTLTNSAQTLATVEVSGIIVKVTPNQVLIARQTPDQLEILQHMVIDCRVGDKQYVRLQFLADQPLTFKFPSSDSEINLQDASGNELNGDLLMGSADAGLDVLCSQQDTSNNSTVLVLQPAPGMTQEPATGTAQVNFTFADGTLKCDYNTRLTGLENNVNELGEIIKNNNEALEKLQKLPQPNDAQTKQLNDLPGTIQQDESSLADATSEIELLQSLERVNLSLELYPGGPVVAYIDFENSPQKP